MKRLYIVRISVVFRYSILYKWFHLRTHSILKILFSKGEKKGKKIQTLKRTRAFFLFSIRFTWFGISGKKQPPYCEKSNR